MRNLVWILLLAACNKEDASTSRVTKHDAAPPPSEIDDTPPAEPLFVSGEGCKTEAECEPLCTKQLARACRELGKLRGLAPADVCKLGDGLSCFELAVTGAGDAAVARATLTASCDHGDAVSCYELAGFEDHGALGGRDTTAAITLRRKACDLGYAQGCFEIGDPTRALALALTACDHGDVVSCGGAMPFAEQIGVERAERVRRRLERALDKPCETDAEACYQGTVVAAGPASAAKWWERADKLWTAACDAGDRSACLELAAVLWPGPDSTPPPQLDRHRDPLRGKKMWQRACDLDPKDEATCAQAKAN